MTAKKKIALVLSGVGELTGGGGTERYFADIFDSYKNTSPRLFDLYFLTDSFTVRRLQEVGKLRRADEVLLLRRKKGRVALAYQLVQMLKFCFTYRFCLIHIAMIAPEYLPFLWLIRALPKRIRPKISITIADCTLAHEYFDQTETGKYEQPNLLWLYRLYFSTVWIDGIYSWYRLFAERFSDGVIRSKPTIVPARYCFVDVQRFRPARQKESRVVFAGRLIGNKQPLFFLEGVRIALDMAPEILKGWQFEIYGKGPLEEQVHDAIESLKLNRWVTVSYTPTMDSVFATSKVFVSTQDYENFTSLAMLEAMAAGNAIISRNVGQTYLFVRDGENGCLLDEDSPKGLAEALIRYLKQPHLHRAFEAKSREIAIKEHCVSNALGDIEAYWRRVLEPERAVVD